MSQTRSFRGCEVVANGSWGHSEGNVILARNGSEWIAGYYNGNAGLTLTSAVIGDETAAYDHYKAICN